MPRHLHRDEISIRSIGEFDGASAATLENAIHNLKTTGDEAILAIGEDLTIASNLTIPANVTLRVYRGATITINNGVAVTILGGVEAGDYQIFSFGGGSASVDFSSAKQREVNVLWWGAVADDSTDNYAPFQYAINSSAAVIHVPGEGTYRFDDKPLINLPGIRLQGQGATLKAGNNFSPSRILEILGGASDIIIDGLVFDTNVSENGGSVYEAAAGDRIYGIMLNDTGGQSPSNVVISNCQFNNMTGGPIYVFCDGLDYLTIRDCNVDTSRLAMFISPNSVNWKFVPQITIDNFHAKACNEGFYIYYGNLNVTNSSVEVRWRYGIYQGPPTYLGDSDTRWTNCRFYHNGEYSSRDKMIWIFGGTGGVVTTINTAQFTNCLFYIGYYWTAATSVDVDLPARATFDNCTWEGGTYGLGCGPDIAAAVYEKPPVKVNNCNMFLNRYAIYASAPIQVFNTTIASGYDGGGSCIYLATANANTSTFVGCHLGWDQNENYSSGYRTAGAICSGVRAIATTFGAGITNQFNIAGSGTKQTRWDIRASQPPHNKDGKAWRQSSSRPFDDSVLTQGVFQWRAAPTSAGTAGWAITKTGKGHQESYGVTTSGSYIITSVSQAVTWSVGDRLISDRAFPNAYGVTVTGVDYSTAQVGLDKPALYTCDSEELYEGRISHWGHIEPITTARDITISSDDSGLVLTDSDAKKWKFRVNTKGSLYAERQLDVPEDY